VELRPDAPDSWLQWCQSLKQAGRAEEALAASHKFLKRFPEHPAALTVRQWQESPEFTAAPSS
jgi:TolA-binding protein